MRYCPRCDTEYLDSVQVCSEDGATLEDKATYDARKAATASVDWLFSVLALSDGFEAEELAMGLVDEGLDASLVSNRTGTLDSLTDPGPEVFNIVVPKDEADRARALLAEWRPEFEAQRTDAANAAVTEEELGEVAHS